VTVNHRAREAGKVHLFSCLPFSMLLVQRGMLIAEARKSVQVVLSDDSAQSVGNQGRPSHPQDHSIN